jgi:hypothetical protein
MNDLRRILESRAAFYSKADTVFDSSDMSPAEAVAALREQLTTALAGLLAAQYIALRGAGRNTRRLQSRPQPPG